LRIEAEVVEDPPGHRRLGDEGDEPQPATAVGAGEDVNGEDLLQEVGPGDARLGGYTGKSSGGPPGTTTISRGLEDVLVAARAISASEQRKRK
jgi:hypothetical protein